MTAPVNTLLEGWPRTREITGRNRQFLGYALSGRYFSPLGRKFLKPLSAAVWTCAVAGALCMAGKVPEEDALSALAVWAVIFGGLGQWLIVSALRSCLEVEIRPQVIRVRRRSGWREYGTSQCTGFAVFPHDRARLEDLKEQQRYLQLQQGENVELPGQFYRNSASVALMARGQRVDIAHIFDRKNGPQGPRRAVKLFMRLGACLQDVQERGWGQ